MNQTVSKLLFLGVAVTLAACASSPAVSLMGNGRFAGIHPGETQDEVRSLAGVPTSETVVAGEPHWIYAFVDSWGMRSVEDVAFDASGHVEATSSMRVGF
jgi:hypothetical protein